MVDTAILPPAAPPAVRPRPVPRWWRDAAASLTWLSVLVVVALWVSNGGLQDLAGGAGAALTSAGRLTGLVSSDLLLVQVLLMSRIPFVERSYGQDELARRHRLVGIASVWLMTAHLVLIVPGYALPAGTGMVAQLWELTVGYPGMLLAWAGTLLIAMVAVTSARAARRRLRYESWHLLHLYAYLGVGLALPHQLWTGGDFLSSPVAALYWWSLWAAAAGAVVGFRVALPAYRSWRHRIVVDRVDVEGPGVVSVTMTGRRLDRLRVEAGQFFLWRFLDGPGWSRANPYSLSAPPGPAGLRIAVRALGDGSARVAALRPGTRVLVEGPYGRLTAQVRTRRRVTLMAAGIGVAPLRALLESLPYGPGEATLVLRASGPDDLVLGRELEQLAARRGARVFFVVGPRRAPGVDGRDSWLPTAAGDVDDVTALRQLVPDVADHDVYVCGAPAWADAVERAARGAGVPADRLHVERFAW